MSYQIRLISSDHRIEAQLVDPATDGIVDSRTGDTPDQALTGLWDVMARLGIEEAGLVVVERGIVNSCCARCTDNNGIA